MAKSKPCGICPDGMCTKKCIEFDKCRKNPYKQEKKGKSK